MSLPHEILYDIFGYLDNLRDFQTVSLVCRSWNEVASDNSLWKRLCKYKYDCKHTNASKINNFKDHVKHCIMYQQFCTERIPTSIQICCTSQLETACQYLLRLSTQMKSSKKTIEKLREYSMMEKIIIAIVEHGEDVNQCNRSLNTPLHDVVEAGSSTLVNFFMMNGAKVTYNVSGKSPYYHAIYLGWEDIIDVLLKYETIAYQKSGLKCVQRANQSKFHIAETHLAVKLKRISILKKLIRSGLPIFDINFATFQNYTLLHAAAHLNNYEIAEFLLQNGSKINEVNTSLQFTEILYAARNKGSDQLVRLLIKYGANVNFRDSRGYSALYYAAFCEDWNTMQVLLNNGADNLVFYLQMFFDYRLVPAAQLLVKFDPQLVYQSYEGIPILEIARRRQFQNICERFPGLDAEIMAPFLCGSKIERKGEELKSRNRNKPKSRSQTATLFCEFFETLVRK